MSSEASESDTLLPSPTASAYDSPAQRKLIDEPDLPTHFTSFTRNVKVCKGLLGLFLPASLGLEIAHLIVRTSSPRHDVDGWGRAESMEVIGETLMDGAGVALTVRQTPRTNCSLED